MSKICEGMSLVTPGRGWLENAGMAGKERGAQGWVTRTLVEQEPEEQRKTGGQCLPVVLCVCGEMGPNQQWQLSPAALLP